MNYIVLSIGGISFLIGLGIIVLTIVVLRNNQIEYILTGMIFALLGASIIWLSFQPGRTFQINIGISNDQFGLLLVGFVFSLFILKGILDIREGSKNLQDKTISSFQVIKSKFQIIVAIIIIFWVVFLLVVAFTQSGK